ncbi:lipid A deacylase LpxR family protein [Mucilaginibacter sp. Bleaf8]|uniref:lipid A deacylase LpxR family protein n=1 Tax=Mucilaginibacter sp. Bleaf8 TaxID=2834430 RepID=UPI001BCF7692|nr:lipid A deacylase LpxR family protein [Mucilaginibacter sp. Bleaf8]MBS7564591.1 lipid A deacylase LpxR family protein [Mucilaginibacter sp. Bleaf8]
MKFKALIATALLGLGFSPLFAQTNAHAHEAGLQSDNDSFLAQGIDRYYTNGLFLFYRQALTVQNPETSKLANKVLGIEAGQKMFNPYSGYVPDPARVDRPFAGYLYAGANLNLLYKNESNLKLGVQTGVIGPAALGEEAQKLMHKTFGFYELAGWNTQIQNSFQLNLLAQYNKLLARASWIDLSGSTYGNLGTGFTGAGVGAIVRAGNFNQLFNSVSTQSTATRNSSIAPLHSYELFAYYKPLFNYVGYDATIQGGLGSDKHPQEITFSPNRTLFTHEIGVAYAGKRWVLNGAVTISGKQINSMVHAHQWGSVTLLYRFN